MVTDICVSVAAGRLWRRGLALHLISPAVGLQLPVSTSLDWVRHVFTTVNYMLFGHN